MAAASRISRANSSGDRRTAEKISGGKSKATVGTLNTPKNSCKLMFTLAHVAMDGLFTGKVRKGKVLPRKVIGT
jgi:hypothetical protein